MSRIANQPINIIEGVAVKIASNSIEVSGKKGKLMFELTPEVKVSQQDKTILVSKTNSSKFAIAMSGTTRAIINNMVEGVSKGFEKKLILKGVGYRAKVEAKKLNLTLGFSHPVVYTLPEGVTAETPTMTEIVLKSCDKQQLGQVAAEIRAYRKPEPYKGKGIRYADEYVAIKATKKK